MKHVLFFSSIFLASLLLSCAGGGEGPVDTGAEAEVPDRPDVPVDETRTPDTPVPDFIEAGDPPAEPSAGCLVEEVSDNVSIEIVPVHPRPGTRLIFNVASPVGHTNVKLVLCGPAGEMNLGSPDVFPGSPNLWVWTAEGLSAGIYQAQFSADPADTVYKTLTFAVEDDPSDGDCDGYASEASGGNDCNDADYDIHPGAEEICGDGIDQDCSGADDTCDFCAPPAGNILAHGEFEEGMSGLAPAGWEVRNPDMPGSCPGSPDSHVYLGSAPPGCSGHSLVIDAGGTWDCYAIQTVSGYFTIEAGRTYRVSAVVRSTGNSVNPAAWFLVGVQWVNAGDGFFGDEKNPRTSSAAENDFDWKLLIFDLVAPPEATRILVWLSAHYPGRVEYDNVSVVRVD
jgi:hypothetical protein